MKKRFFIAALAAALAFWACDSSGDDGTPAPPVNNPLTGEMTEDTAKQIFKYEPETGNDPVTIKQFINDTALLTYLKIGAPAAVRGEAPARVSTEGRDLVLNKIAGRDIVDIADNAFNPAIPGTAKLDAAGVVSVKLPETLTAIGENSFKGAEIVALLIPAAAKAHIPQERLDTLAANSGAAVVETSSGDVPLDRLTLDDIVPGGASGISSGALGENPVIAADAPVYLKVSGEYGEVDLTGEEYLEESADNMDVLLHGNNGSAENNGKIAQGKFSMTLGKPAQLKSFTEYEQEYQANPDRDTLFEDFYTSYDNLVFSEPEAKYFFMTALHTSAQENNKGVLYKRIQKQPNKFTPTNAENTAGLLEGVFADIVVRYIYVDRNVTFSGKAKQTSGWDHDIENLRHYNTTEDFTINLEKGWNAISIIAVGEFTQTIKDDKPVSGFFKTITSLKHGDANVHWVLTGKEF